MIYLNNPLKNSLTAFALLVGLGTPILATASDLDIYADPPTTPVVSEKLMQARLDVRDLLLDSFFWTASAACSTVSSDQSMFPVADKKVSESIMAIENYATNFIGAEKSKEMAGLLKIQYGALLAYAKSVNTNDATVTEAAEKALYAGNTQVIDYIVQNNEHIAKEELTERVNLLTKQYIEQIKFSKAKDVNGFANLWGEMKKSVYGLADLAVNALAKKYPDKF